jgi:hypothetical protein
MDKKIAGLAGAMTSLASMHAAEAVPVQNETEIMNPRSYSELLQPIPNAVALLKAVDRANAARVEAEAKRKPRLAQYYYHHHHHHHHNYYYRRPYYHHHHHHHHHHSYYPYYYYRYPSYEWRDDE